MEDSSRFGLSLASVLNRFDLIKVNCMILESRMAQDIENLSTDELHWTICASVL